MFTYSLFINVVINVEGRNGQLDYEKTYRHVHEASKIFLADGQGLNKNLNFALNSAIKESRFSFVSALL